MAWEFVNFTSFQVFQETDSFCKPWRLKVKIRCPHCSDLLGSCTRYDSMALGALIFVVPGVWQSSGIWSHSPRYLPPWRLLGNCNQLGYVLISLVNQTLFFSKKKKKFLAVLLSEATRTMFSVDHMNQLFSVKLFASSPALLPI